MMMALAMLNEEHGLQRKTFLLTPSDQAHRRQWSVAELPSGAAPC